MKKNKILVYFVIIVMCLSSVIAYPVSRVDDAAILVQEIKYEPYPASPGRYVDVWLKIENFGSRDATDFTIELLPEFPFSLDSNEDAVKTFGTILAHQTVLVKYKVRIAEKAVEGSNYLKFRYKTALGEKWKDGVVDIFIRTSDANIAVSSIKAERIAQGVATPIEIELQNLADSTLNDINVKLDLSGDVPLVPISSTNEQKIYKLFIGERKAVVFNLMALPDAKSGVYKVPIEITFKDGTGSNYTKSGIIGLVIGEEPDLSVIVDKAGIYKTGETGNIVIKFTNKGLSDIKLLNVIMKPSENYDIISPAEVYIGNIDSDDYESAEFRIKAKRSQKGIVNLVLELQYLDSNNQRYDKEISVPLKIISADKLGVKQGSSLGLLITAAAIVVIGYFAYKKWEKKRQQKKAKK